MFAALQSLVRLFARAVGPRCIDPEPRCMQSLWVLLRALAVAALVVCPPTAAAQASAAPPLAERAPLAHEADSDAIPKRGILYESRSGASTLYLFGTLHVGKPDFYPLDARTNEAFAASSVLYLELDLADATLAKTATDLAAYPEGTSLDRALPPELMTRVDAALKRYRIPREAGIRMKPWMLGQTFLLLQAAQDGYNPAFATEIHLLGLAAAQGKKVRGLETLADQFAVFERLPESGQQRFLADILDALDDAQLKQHLDSLVGAWASGDAHALEEELARERSDGTAFARDVLPRLVDDRNQAMAQKIAAIATSGQRAFVAVGALHLVGPKGIVALLRARGFSVRPL
jgi:uncharacterized protein YbaP (TraB family)